MKVVLLLLLCTVGAAACFVLRSVLRGRDKRSLLRDAHGIGSSLSEEIGISVLCSGIDAPERIDALLGSEYTRFEAIVVLDAGGFPEEFAQLTARYRMIRVEWHGSQEFPTAGIRSLWRSRRRSCRRLVLVDRPQRADGTAAESSVADWNAAAAVAAYDYLLPLDGRTALLPDAVIRLVAELGEHRACAVDVVRSRIGMPVALIARDVVMEAGGFGRRLLRQVPRRKRLELWESLACRAARADAAKRVRMEKFVLRAAVIAAFIVTGWAVVAGYWTGAAVTATVAVVAGAVAYGRQALASGRNVVYLKRR